jgi:hypothetical protein
MDYAELSNEIEIEIPKHAKANYQYVTIRYLLLVQYAKKKEIIDILKKYNQDSENDDFQSVFDTLLNPKFSIIVEKNKKISLANRNDFKDPERYDLVLKCDHKIKDWKDNGYGTDPMLEQHTFKEAAKIVLKKIKRSMHYVEITDIALSENLISTDGMTPHQTMHAQIGTDIQNEEESDFIKTGESEFFINYKYEVVESKEELRKVQELLLEKLNKDTTKSGKIKLGTQKGPIETMAGWISSEGFWWSSKTNETRKNHYWNVFGLEEPKWESNTSHKMRVQINPPIEGRDRNTGGVFLKNSHGQYFLGHNGSVGGGSEGVGKWNFQNFMYYSDNWIEAIDSKKIPEDLILISKIDSSNFLKNIKNFIQKTYEFKHIPDKEKFLINPEKFSILHEKFLKYIFDKSILKKYSEEEAVFKDFKNKFLNDEEILDKKNIVTNARNILEIEKWELMIKTPGLIIGKLKEICNQKVSKPLITAPQYGTEKGQDTILYNLKGDLVQEFEKKIFNLFLESTEEDTFSKNFDALIEFLETNKLPIRSQFFAYISFIADHEKYIPIRIREFENVLEYYDCYDKISKFSWKRYNTFLTLIQALKAKLSEKYPTPDTIETHSYLWVVSSILKNKEEIKKEIMQKNVQNTSEEDFSEYFKILENKNQFIFYGPPGTGKTWKAGNIARAFIEKSRVYGFSDTEYEEYIRKSLQNISDSNLYKLIPFGDDKFLIRNPDNEIRGKLIFIQSGKSNPNRCEVTIDDDTIKHLSEVDDEKRFIIVVNEDTKNFLVIPHKLIIEKFKISGDQTGKQLHRIIVNIERNYAEYMYPYDIEENFWNCSHLLHNLDIMFNENSQPCEFYEKVTFHQTFSYEDFIEGIRPEISDNKKYITYPVKPGIFKKICGCAKNDQNQRYVLLIDEINRGNISKIFGELITLLEKDKRGKKNSIRLPYSKDSFDVPPNLYVIGTMNTADRSLVKLDVALRRRFAFVELMPQPDELKNIPIGGFKVPDILRTLNKRIRDKSMREYQIGHSYFMPDGDTVKDISKLQYIFAYEIIPLLKEYFFDNKKMLQDILNKQFIDWKDETITDDWQKDEKKFIEYLGVFMNETSSTK